MNDFEKILTNQILPLVSKPGRYVGNEVNVIRKDWSEVDLTFALVFPDLYELGMSHVGFQILYHILNSESFVSAERVFAPDVDLERILKEREYFLFSLESKKFLHEFDIVGFTLQYELHYTNILNMIDLGGIPLHSSDRQANHPIVLAGGPCAFNPEPMTDFIDAFVIGDGEEVVLEIARFIRQAKSRQVSRKDILKGLANISGVYVPQFYGTESPGSVSIKPLEKDVPVSVKANVLSTLKSQNYSEHPLVPLIETTHDRYSIEIMRGCTRGCRFCNAGVTYRPVRERHVNDLIEQAVRVIDNTGYDELSLVSLSTSDYSQLQELLSNLGSTLSKKNVNVSFPSLRSETFTPEIARYAKSVRKSGITLAPEAGTDYLRSVINKNNTNEDLLRSVTLAYDEGWNLVKLYFMVGQPLERDEDLEGIVSLVRQVISIAKKYKGKSVNVSISPFSPKPFTPFQWAGQDSTEELNRKINFIRDRLRSNRLKLSWRNPEVSFLEAVIGRGDRRLNAVIEKAWKLGAKFDAWSDHFNFETWQNAFRENDIDPVEYVRQRDVKDALPWDHIDKGVTKSFLKREYDKARKGEETDDCRLSGCNACGLMSQPVCQDIIHDKEEKSASNSSKNIYGRTKKMVQTARQDPVASQFRLKYRKGDEIRYTSHLDMIRIFERALRRADIRLVYTQGFHPHPKISYGPSLGVGFMSEAEYLDIHIYPDSDRDIVRKLNRSLPKGIEVTEAKRLIGKQESLVSVINRAVHRVVLNKIFDQSYLKEQIAALWERDDIWVERIRKGSLQKVDIKPYIKDIEINGEPDVLRITTHMSQGSTARIGEILKGVLELSEEEIALSNKTRMELLISKGSAVVTPMEI